MIQRKYKKDYSWPSQLKLLENMKVYQGVSRCLRTLNTWLQGTEADKYLIRRRRIKKHPEYGMVFRSTLYKITIKGYLLIASMGVNVSAEIRKYMEWLNEISPDRGRYGMNIARRTDPDRDTPLQVRKEILESLAV
jgi:hypothetical protein